MITKVNAYQLGDGSTVATLEEAQICELGKIVSNAVPSLPPDAHKTIAKELLNQSATVIDLLLMTAKQVKAKRAPRKRKEAPAPEPAA